MAAAPVPSEELRRAVAAELRPVRPLASPWRRAALVAAWAPAAVAVVVTALGLRRDALLLGWPLTWGPFALEVSAGLTLVAMALSAAVPGRGPTRRGSVAALSAAGIVFVTQASMTRAASPGLLVPDPFLSVGPTCFALQALLGLSALAIVLGLIARAAPLQATRAGALGAGGAGLMAEGSYHLHCQITDLRHALPWHGGAVVALILVGLVAGLLWERSLGRRMLRRLAALGR